MESPAAVDAAGVREERKAETEVCRDDAVQVEVRVLPPGTSAPPYIPYGYGPGWPKWQRQTAINLRLLLQTQHAPPIAGSTGPVPVCVEMPVRLRPAELRSAVV